MRKSYKVALGGIIMALSTLCMAATSLFPAASFALPAAAGVLLIVLNIELGSKWAVSVYVGVSLLSLFLSSDYLAVVSFIALLGYYPIVKESIERLRRPVLEWILKIILLNVTILIGSLITLLFLGSGALMAEYGEFGLVGIIIYILGLNGAFVIYDIALTRIVTLIILKFIPLLKKIK